ncbi:MAG: hypothetical protein JW955_10960 [Sedimentisphaerales bacterium]|nr:hypothetical protein [Sedimentisphaerales bacterium]
MNRRAHGASGHISRILLLTLVGLMVCAVTPAQAGWTITQLTNNSIANYHPAISGTNVVWEGWDGTDDDIYSNFAGQLTDNSTPDEAPDISGTNVV